MWQRERGGGILIGMASRDELRAADADREAVAERLREAAGEGRLDLDEYDQRLGQAYAARTYGELDRLLADLPASTPAPSGARASAPGGAGPASGAGPAGGAAGEPAAVRGWLAAYWRPWTTVVSICVAIWAVTALVSFSLPYFWPFWVAVPWGAVLAVRTIGGLHSGEPHRWAAARIPHPRTRRRCC